MNTPEKKTRSEAQKRADAKYERRMYTILGCKIRRTDAEQFKAICKALDTTPNAIFTDVVRKYLSEYKSAQDDS